MKETAFALSLLLLPLSSCAGSGSEPGRPRPSHAAPPAERPAPSARAAAAPSAPAAPSPGRIEGNPEYAPGKWGLGLAIDAVGERVVYPTKGILEAEEGTVEFWMNPLIPTEDSLGMDGILSVAARPYQVAPNQNAMTIFMNKTKIDMLAFVINGTNIAATNQIEGLGWRPGAWRHVAAVWGGSRPALYVDGAVPDNPALVGAAIWGAGLFSSSTLSKLPAQFSFGAHDWLAWRHRFFPAVYDELRVSRRMRTEEEIAASAQAAGPLEPDDATTLLEHFEGSPVPPLRAESERAYNRFAPGEEVRLRVAAPAIPGDPAPEREASLVVAAEGTEEAATASLRARRGEAGRRDVSLGAFARPGLVPLDLRRIEDGRVLAAAKSRVWIAEPITARAADSPFGETGNYDLRMLDERFFRDLAEVGGRWSRVPLGWGQTEPEKGKFRWERFDRVVDWAEKYGVQVVPTFVWPGPDEGNDVWKGVPRWAGDDPNGPPERWEDFFDFVRAAAARYRGRVAYWTLWNEPNLKQHWAGSPDPAEYARMLEGAYKAVKAGDPAAKVVGLSLGFVDREFAEEVFRRGGGKWMDVAALHLYRMSAGPDDPFPIDPLSGANPAGTLWDALQAFKQILDRHGLRDMRVWLEETGYPSGDEVEHVFPGVGEDNQATHLVKTYAEALGTGFVERVLWFNFRGLASFELSDYEGSVKPATLAYRNLALRLQGMKATGRERLPQGVTAVRFEGGGGRATVLWSTRGMAPVTLRNPSGGPLQEYDYLGRAAEAGGRFAEKTIKVSNKPTIVAGDATAAVGK